MKCIPCDFLTNYFMINYFRNLFEAAVNRRYRWISFIKKKEVLQMTHMYAQFCGYCFWSLSTCASISFLNICLYYNIIEKPYREKRQILLWCMRLSYWSTESLTMFLDHIIRRFDVVLESRGVREGCNTIISPSTTVIPILPFGTPVNKYSTATKFCKIKIFEKYALGSISFWQICDCSLEL